MPTEASSETAPEESLAGSAAEEISLLSPGQMLSAARAQKNLTQRQVVHRSRDRYEPVTKFV